IVHDKFHILQDFNKVMDRIFWEKNRKIYWVGHEVGRRIGGQGPSNRFKNHQQQVQIMGTYPLPESQGAVSMVACSEVPDVKLWV
ncbi:hypothetical protein, partial [Candidatus Hakubella thermalkaliphila]|uniref:hypothetical protein n=1 Tax=Candidatus Hakubella thermalkaliphila TaxID=2754717 RepID=UPI001C614B64